MLLLACATPKDKQLDMIMSTPHPTAMLLVVVLTSTLLVLLTPPACGTSVCGIRVDETAGQEQSDGTKLYDVTVTNQGSIPVRDVRLYCGFRFRPVRGVDQNVLVQVKPGDSCLLVNGSAITPGAKVSFAYTSYIRYTMDIVSASCHLGLAESPQPGAC